MTLQPVLEILRAQFGLDPESLGLTTVPQIVAARQRALSLANSDDYAALLRRSAAEREILLDALVVPETWFFRGGELFTYLAEHIRRLAASRSAARPVRILSAPCSTGEEPYSLVMVLDELAVPPNLWHIEACDINERHLARARHGVYGEFTFRQTDAQRRERFFRSAERGSWELNPEIRARVRFRQGNLVAAEFLAGDAPYDLIFCRNVMIYLHDAARRQVIAALDRLLAPTGVIAMGPAEPLGTLDRQFTCLGPDGYFLYCRTAALETVATALGIAAPEKEPRPVIPPRAAAAAPATARGAPRAPQQAAVGGARQTLSSAGPRAVRKRKEEVEPATMPPMSDPLSAARQLADHGHLEAAWDACQSLLASAGPTADVYALMGIIQQARHEHSESKRSFEKSLYLDPQHREALLHLMLLCEQQGAHDQARVLRQRIERAGSRGDA